MIGVHVVEVSAASELRCENAAEILEKRRPHALLSQVVEIGHMQQRLRETHERHTQVVTRGRQYKLSLALLHVETAESLFQEARLAFPPPASPRRDRTRGA